MYLLLFVPYKWIVFCMMGIVNCTIACSGWLKRTLAHNQLCQFLNALCPLCLPRSASMNNDQPSSDGTEIWFGKSLSLAQTRRIALFGKFTKKKVLDLLVSTKRSRYLDFFPLSLFSFAKQCKEKGSLLCFSTPGQASADR